MNAVRMKDIDVMAMRIQWPLINLVIVSGTSKGNRSRGSKAEAQE
jgi:hypothetical protein